MKGFDKIIWQLFYQKSKLSKQFLFNLSEINRLTYHKDLFIAFLVNTPATKCCISQSKIIAIPISIMLANKVQIKALFPEASEGTEITFHLHHYLSSKLSVFTSPFHSYRVSFSVSVFWYTVIFSHQLIQAFLKSQVFKLCLIQLQLKKKWLERHQCDQSPL